MQGAWGPQELDVTDDSGNAGGREARGGFLGFVAHEVRNPLSTALWSAELLTRMSPEERGGARGEKLSAMALRSVARVRHLVEDHFLCERLDAGGIPLRPERVALRAAVDAMLEHRPAEAGDVNVEVDSSLVVTTDPTLLDRALEALVAVAGRGGAAVRVTARAAGDAIVLEVSGAPPGDATLDDPVKGSPSDPRGRALALPLVRRIAAALDGGVAIRDEGYVLSLRGAPTYAARPKPPAPP